ncbi:MAG: hypothetical protein EZS28_040546 [Streblomastix strix]|uniref:Uncharacterized protein n=1 Tax=Streblomastix strix TaxID=222440 RepID=A0A5J4TZQ7_9EUKA|nr:MAG: hypothetical protein EZS28_040546 [Streblomastix strix]
MSCAKYAVPVAIFQIPPASTPHQQSESTSTFSQSQALYALHLSELSSNPPQKRGLRSGREIASVSCNSSRNPSSTAPSTVLQTSTPQGQCSVTYSPSTISHQAQEQVTSFKDRRAPRDYPPAMRLHSTRAISHDLRRIEADSAVHQRSSALHNRFIFRGFGQFHMFFQQKLSWIDVDWFGSNPPVGFTYSIRILLIRLQTSNVVEVTYTVMESTSMLPRMDNETGCLQIDEIS